MPYCGLPLSLRDFMGGSIRWLRDPKPLSYSPETEERPTIYADDERPDDEKNYGIEHTLPVTLDARDHHGDDNRVVLCLSSAGDSFLLAFTFPSTESQVSGAIYVRVYNEYVVITKFQSSGGQQNVANFVQGNGGEDYGLLIPLNNPFFICLHQEQLETPIDKLTIHLGRPRSGKLIAKMHEELWGHQGFSATRIEPMPPSPKLLKTVQFIPHGIIHQGYFQPHAMLSSGDLYS